MPVRVTCPQCRKTYSVGDHLLGKAVKCPACQTKFTTSSKISDAVQEKPSAPAMPSKPAPSDPESRPKRRNIIIQPPMDRSIHESRGAAPRNPPTIQEGNTPPPLDAPRNPPTIQERNTPPPLDAPRNPPTIQERNTPPPLPTPPNQRAVDESDGSATDESAPVMRTVDESDAPSSPGRSDSSFDDTPIAGPDGRAVSIDKFKIVRPLGGGGQASAQLAFDPDLNRHVVLKVYHEARTREQQEAVLREGRALARVRSPFVAQCFNVERRDGVPYLVMEYIPGENLDERHRSQPPSIEQSLEWIRKAAQGLEAVHACGLLHRDLKPGNIIAGEDGEPHLVDFGLAAPVASDHLNQLSGTLAYMAPEQARREGERIDPRTDVYGLGGVLYFLLTGSPPRRGKTQQALIDAAAKKDVTPAGEVNPGIPPEVNALCMRCLARAPANRFGSARELADAISGLQKRRHNKKLAKYAVAGVLALAAAVLLIVGARWLLSSSDPTTDQVADAPKAIDLLTLIDPGQHVRQGKWTRTNGTLKTEKGLAYIPYDQVPKAYELTVQIRSFGLDHGQDFCLGILAGAHRTRIVLNALGGKTGGLEQLDGLPLEKNETMNPYALLPTGKENKIVCRVVANRIMVSINGRTVIDWKGDFARLSDPVAVNQNIPVGRFYLWLHGPYEINRIDLRPLSEIEAERFAPVPRPNAPANGVVLDRALNTVTRYRQFKMGRSFIFAKSWRFMMEYRLAMATQRAPRSFVFFWGDARPGKDGLFVSQEGSKLRAGVGNVPKNGVHQFLTNIEPPIRHRWIEFDLRYNAKTKEITLYADGRLIKREQCRVIPHVDRPMPVYLGSASDGAARFGGWIRRVWFGNVNAEDLPAK